ncbi:hypothetical protein FQU23_011260 [Flavobacterium sp. XN-5]|uniref:Uncharacterized protein n=1 Tax=Flavobacterium hiemivividum TaxID=2541734 RepID=A0A4R5CY44_9FLAO|nr:MULTISPECIES: hypothetical protein [Flavobacterium]NGY38087.1 hypothetical protein [Flavobacterium sp. XN-5]TDE04031.1 hypothetical protein E0F98_08725 [Flavobacterium hiemivividum]
MEKVGLQLDRNTKKRDLFLGLLFDAIGMLSFTVPMIGEFSDVIWAPVAAYLMTRMYKGTAGRVGGVVAFLEEILPFTDFIPSFTLMWFYNYVIKRESKS